MVWARILDTPGHVNFVEDVAPCLRLDSAVLVIDVVKGIQIRTERLINQAVLEEFPLTSIVNNLHRHMTSSIRTLSDRDVTRLD